MNVNLFDFQLTLHYNKAQLIIHYQEKKGLIWGGGGGGGGETSAK